MPIYKPSQLFADEDIETDPCGWSAPGIRFGLPEQTKRKFDMNTLILFLAGLLCFWIFYKSIDFFEKI